MKVSKLTIGLILTALVLVLVVVGLVVVVVVVLSPGEEDKENTSKSYLMSSTEWLSTTEGNWNGHSSFPSEVTPRPTNPTETFEVQKINVSGIEDFCWFTFWLRLIQSIIHFFYLRRSIQATECY